GLPAGAAELPTRLSTRFTWLGFSHVEGPACELLALEPLHGRGGRRVIRHFDKTKPTGTAGVPIRYDIDPVHHPIGLKELAQVLFCRRKGEIAHKNIHAEVLCMMTSPATIARASAPSGGAQSQGTRETKRRRKPLDTRPLINMYRNAATLA